MIRGQTENIALNPIGGKQLLETETFGPVHLELRNGLRTDGGFYKLRPGMKTRWQITTSSSFGQIPYEQPVTLLAPLQVTPDTKGLAVTEDGKVFGLLNNLSTQIYAGPTLNGIFRPTWCQFDQIPILCDGQAVIKVNRIGSTTDLLGGNPPAAKFCAVVADRVVLSGYDDVGFQWSSPGNAENWPVQNTSSVTGHGEAIRYMQVNGTDLYFFKDASIEIWSHLGGLEIFGRRGIITVMDKFMVRQGIAGYSVVQAGTPPRFYFYCNGDFWRLDGFNPIVISGTYKREIGKLETTHDLYGFHFSHEHVIRWFAPTDGKCFTYDYINDVFTEDNAWPATGQHDRMPIFSYMEADGEAFVGSYAPTGRVSHWSELYATDDGMPIRLLRRLRIPLSQKGHTARVNQVRVRVERGQGFPLSTENLWGDGTFETGIELFDSYNGGVIGLTTGQTGQGLQVTASSTITGNNYGGIHHLFPRIVPGRRYRLQFAIKRLIGTDPLVLHVSVQDGLGDENNLSSNVAPTGTDWNTITKTAYVDDEKSHFYLWSLEANAQWVIDNLVLYDVTTEGRTPVFLARWVFDEGTWTPYQSVSLGAVGERDPYVMVTHPSGVSSLGIGRDFKLELVQTDEVRHVLTHANLTVQELGR